MQYTRTPWRSHQLHFSEDGGQWSLIFMVKQSCGSQWPRKNKEPRETSFSFRFPFVKNAWTTASNSYLKIRDPCASCQPLWTDSLELCPWQKAITTDLSKLHLPSTVHLPAIVRGLRSNVPALQTLVHRHDQQTTTRLHERAYGFSAEEGRKDSFWRSLRGGASEGETQISFSVLSHQQDELRLHVEEPMAIKSPKPELNRRQEELGTGFLP